MVEFFGVADRGLGGTCAHPDLLDGDPIVTTCLRERALRIYDYS